MYIKRAWTILNCRCVNYQDSCSFTQLIERRSSLAARMLLSVQPEVPITLEILHLVFSAFGMVYKIATFEKQAGLQALVQFGDVGTAERVSLYYVLPAL